MAESERAPKKKHRNGSSANRLQIAERRSRIAKLNAMHYSCQQIADQLLKEYGTKVSRETVRKDINWLANNAERDGITEYEINRYIELESIRAQQQVLNRDVFERRDLNAHRVYNELGKERRKILGLYAPIQVQVQQLLEAEIDEFIQFLEKNISQSAFEEVVLALQNNTSAVEKAAVN